MNEALKLRLLSFGLSEDHVAKLTAEGVETEADLALLTADDLKGVLGCGLILAKKLHAAFAPVAPVAATVPAAEPAVPPDAVIPDGANPSPALVNTFATSMGIDANMLSMFMLTGMTGGTGMDMDFSSMLPIPQIVAGYNPKLRNMPYMIMGQVEKRLGTPIVVINADGSVNPDMTVKYVMSLEEGFEPATDGVHYDDEGQPYEVIRVGVDAQSIYDADPLVPTRAIPKSGIGHGRVNWNHVSLEVRQVVFYAATQTGELDANDEAKTSWLRDHINPASTRLGLRGQCPKALSAYNEAARTGSLPTLRVMLGRGPRKPEAMPRRRPATPRDVAGIGRDSGDGSGGGTDPFLRHTSVS